MVSTTVVTQGPSPEEDFGLDAVAQHNAATSVEQFPPYEEDLKGLGIYDPAYYQDDNQFYVHNPPTPRSNTASDGIRTRSGRSTRRTDSPFSTSKSRVSKSPAARTKKEKKPSKLDRSKTPKLTAPLSVLTKDMEVPLKDMDAWVNRPADVRRKEVEKRNGYVTRPMNSFMLYRSCYAERTKQWCLQNNHQVVSSVSGESWPMEPEEVRNQFNEWAKIERANHQAAHPEYKFSPSKSTNKRRKSEMTDDEDDVVNDWERNPDGEYRGAGGRSVRQRRQMEHDAVAAAYLPSNVGFELHPYFGQQGNPYEQAQYSYNTGRPPPSNVSYDTAGIAYNPQTGTYVQTSAMHQQHPQHQQQQPQQYTYMHHQQAGVRIPTPNSLNGGAGQSSLGTYGLPGGSEDIFATTSSRTGTPAMHQAQYNAYGQPLYPQYYTSTPQPSYQQLPPQMYEHAQYLQQASQPQAAIDPGLEAALGESHFDDAIGDMTALPGITEYFEESTSPDQTLAPSWSAAEALGGP
ncbi:hypothetical protein LTR37_016948 [Vermiconidia calcicola]|uniref:Uncharacterized protein n=1 Tax=Vermiconidia calcicola TaxID=1690605 RepID=A0ACC3MLK2_9PEZI|nr:hypothetical protein LTR37_016948 [Vermiconidia calcicola]